MKRGAALARSRWGHARIRPEAATRGGGTTESQQQQEGLPDRLTLMAFTGAVLIGGINFVAVRFSNRELPPLFGSGTRFAAAAVLLLVAMRWQRIPFPRGATLFGTVVYGVFGFTVGYALAYWALLQLSAGIGAVVLAAIPLITLLIAPLHGIERFRRRGLVGSLLAVAGIAILASPRAGDGIPLLPLLAMLGAAVAFAEAGVIVKKFPPTHPVATNATGMAVGGLLLVLLSALAGESWDLPEQSTTWLAFVYLVLLGSVGLFGLFLFTLGRWRATAVSYMTALFPVVAMIAGALIAGEAITLNGAVGGAVVLAGVYVGVLSRERRAAPMAVSEAG